MNRNIVNLARLYDCIAKELDNTMSNTEMAISYNDERLKTKVRWLGDIAKTLSLVYQIEKLRAKPGAESVMPEQQDSEDPATKQAQGGNDTKQTPPEGFPGGWTPFQ